eukprot:403289-Pyramimonas_sp.AAC.1
MSWKLLVGEPNLHCAVSEANLASWPAGRWRDPRVGRIDNINACMRAFTVDGRSTKSIGEGAGKVVSQCIQNLLGAWIALHFCSHSYSDVQRSALLLQKGSTNGQLFGGRVFMG